MGVLNILEELKRRRRRRFITLNKITLSQAALLGNLEFFRRLRPDAAIIPVLKANAYGHGLEPIARTLNRADCPFLAVDGSFEAARLRRCSRHRILVMGYIRPQNVHLLDTRHCSFVVQDIEGLRAFAALNRPVNIHLELNTGMNRLGLSENELPPYLALLKRFPKLKLEGVMSHLADADNSKSDSFSQLQYRRFSRLLAEIRQAGFRPAWTHLAQTAGSLSLPGGGHNAIRLGIGLYGLNPLAENDARYRQLAALKPVLGLTSTIIKVIKLAPGDAVSYGCTFRADRPMSIGVLPIGYYEGWPRALSNCGSVMLGDQQLRVVGRVCMNHTMVSLEGTEVTAGKTVTVISDDAASPAALDQICRRHELFNYSFVTGLAPSLRRETVL